MINRFFFILIFVSLQLHAQENPNGDSWDDILTNKKGVVKYYWYPNNVIVENSRDIIDGIERDLAFSFIEYLNEKHGVKIQLEWIQTESFEEVLHRVKSGRGGTFGASSISITRERSQLVNFTPPYMADVAVMVSHPSIPVAISEKQLRQVLTGKKAVTIKNTTLLKALLQLQTQLSIPFELTFVPNSGDILTTIVQEPGTFGYIDIANFLIAVDNKINIRRQLFYPIKLDGLAMIYPKNSDWEQPVTDYFSSPQFEEDKRKIISRYLGPDASEIIERISKSAEMGPLEEIILSNREKEEQYEQLLLAAENERKTSRILLILIGLVSFGLILSAILYFRYRVKIKTNRQLQQYQQQLLEANEKLQQLNDEKNNLIKVLAHDLRSPLSNIMSATELLKSGKNVSEDAIQVLELIVQSTGKISTLISKILDVNAIESGELNLTIGSLDIHEIIHKVVENYERYAKEKHISLTVSTDQELRVSADQVYTEQIIENLVSNAIKYSPNGSKVHVEATDNGETVRVSVRDEGPGLTPEDQKKLFRKFQPLSAKPTGGETSTGLGLSIVKTFTEKMGGKVSYETQLGKGTTFHIDLRKA